MGNEQEKDMHRLINVKPGQADVVENGKSLGSVIKVEKSGGAWAAFDASANLIPGFCASRSKAINKVLVANGYQNPIPPVQYIGEVSQLK